MTRLRKAGRVLEVDARGRCRVAVGGLTTWCTSDELAPVAGSRKKPSSAAHPAAHHPGTHRRHEAPPSGVATSLGRIDLHGLTVPEALEALEERLDQAIRGGLDRLEVVHGISGGRLRSAVRRYLAATTAVSRVEIDSRNAGVTWVHF